MRTHELKIWPSFFEKVLSGEKAFEIRRNDRDFAEGDRIVLQEYDPSRSHAVRRTGRVWKGTIGYLTNYEQKPGFVVFAILEDAEIDAEGGK